ncbi:MAG TPA: cytochrome c-type biogenesis protein CcmH [Terracidiphilus sp.]|jgi:cytochrome c-type biogenesis protein CcmH|nr:cytochrome c-type biogenesis protein CcmH [Terracidiphilus sp.]
MTSLLLSIFRALSRISFRAPSFPRFLRKGWESNEPRPISRTNSLSFWLKTAQAAFLAVAVCFSLGASDAGSRYNNLNHRTMCTCGCAEILGECNHVGCSASTEELAMIRDGLANNQSDQAILDAMVARYGAVVLAAPTRHGFDLVAWIAPFAVFGAALLGTILLVRHWTVGKTQLAAQLANAQAASPEMTAIREQIRRETGDGD